MNKFAKALLLAVVLAAPVAVSVPAQAKTVSSSTRMHHTKRHRAMHHNNVKSMSGKTGSLKK